MPAVVDHCRHQVWGCAHTPSVGNYSTLPTNLHAQLAKFKGTACLTTAVQLSQYLPFVSNWKSGRVTLHKFQGLSVMYSCFTINVSFCLCKLMLFVTIGGVLPVRIQQPKRT